MNRPLLVVAVSTLALVACAQKQETAPVVPPAPAAVVAPAQNLVAAPVEATAPVAADTAKPVDAAALPGEPKLQPK